MSSEKSTRSEFRLLFKASGYQEFKALDKSVKLKVAARKFDKSSVRQIDRSRFRSAHLVPAKVLVA